MHRLRDQRNSKAKLRSKDMSLCRVPDTVLIVSLTHATPAHLSQPRGPGNVALSLGASERQQLWLRVKGFSVVLTGNHSQACLTFPGL